MLAVAAALLVGSPIVVDGRPGSGPSPAKMAGYFASASAPETAASIDPKSEEILRRIGFRRVRLINGEADSSYELASDEFQLGVRLTNGLAMARRLKLEAHVVVGQTLPAGLSVSDGDVSSGGGTYGRYAVAALRALLRDAPKGPLLVEVSNELDATHYRNNLWTVRSDFGVGSEERYRHLFGVYRSWAKAAEVVEPRPPRRIQIAGPASALAGWAYAPFNWFERFIRDVRSEGLRLDVFSYHYYGDQGAIGDGVPHPDIPALEVQLRSVRRWLDEAGFRKTRIALTEWAPTAGTADAVLGRPNAELEGAAWAASFAFHAASNSLDDASYLLVNDRHGDAEAGVWSEGSLLHYDRGRLSPKAPFLAAELLREMPVQAARPVTGRPLGVTAFAARSPRKLSVMVANSRLEYRYADKVVRDHGVDAAITLLIRQLPFRGRAKVVTTKLERDGRLVRRSDGERRLLVRDGDLPPLNLVLRPNEVAQITVTPDD